MHVKKVYEDGAIFQPEVLDITPADIRAKFQQSITNMAAISLASGYITKPAIPHLLANAFKNLAAVTFDSDYSFKQADKLKEASKNASVAVSKAAPAGKKEAAVEKEEVKEEEADVDMGNMFGDEYWGFLFWRETALVTLCFAFPKKLNTDTLISLFLLTYI